MKLTVMLILLAPYFSYANVCNNLNFSFTENICNMAINNGLTEPLVQACDDNTRFRDRFFICIGSLYKAKQYGLKISVDKITYCSEHLPYENNFEECLEIK